ncbi:MAG: hypothetical protein HYY16_12240 [Planctomycetes bacterium]|nr:hypothetical protein [Planctomycetota bacterium]
MRALPALLAIGAALACASNAAAQDKIRMRDGSTVWEGTIISLTYKEVTYETSLAGVPQSQATKDVLEIEFDWNRKPYDYSSGESAFKKNDFDEACARFERVLKDGSAADSYKQFAQWFIIQCHLGSEPPRYEDAIAATKKLRSQWPDSYFLRDSFDLQYGAAEALGNAAALKQVLTDFEKTAQEKNVDEWKRAVELMRAELAERISDFKGARAIYEKFSTDRDPQISLEAKLGVLRCLSNMNEWNALSSRAKDFINDAANKPDTPRLLMGAYLARGKALLNAKKHKEALLDFMRCHLDLAPKAGDACDREHEEALALAAVACARLAGEQEEKDRKELYRGRAYELQDELGRRYPGSALTDTVQKAIKEIPR